MRSSTWRWRKIFETVFSLGEINMDTEAVAQILGSPYAVVGLSDGGAHVQFHSNVSNPTRLLGYWVREKGIMSLELAVRRLTFDSASAFGIYDRGLIQPGMAADLVVFDPDTVRPVAEDKVHDFPANGWRMRELAEGIHYTVVNGEVLMEKGTHTGSLPAGCCTTPGTRPPDGRFARQRAPSPRTVRRVGHGVGTAPAQRPRALSHLRRHRSAVESRPVRSAHGVATTGQAGGGSRG
mgnify:CR=1 FL=1